MIMVASSAGKSIENGKWPLFLVEKIFTLLSRLFIFVLFSCSHTKVLASEETFPTVVWCKEVMGFQKGCNVVDLCVEVATIMVLRVCRGNVS
jgi:hypothetical protein